MTVNEKLNADAYVNKCPYKSARQDAAANAAYERGKQKCIDEFRHDAATECDVLGHPQEQKLWDMAWNHGHASGFGEIWIYYQDFSELLCRERHSKSRKVAG